MSMEGKALPAATFKIVSKSGDWSEINLSEIAKNKTIVIFGLPGAFTPTCSASHLPRFDELYEALSKTVNDVFCVSVNDTFVMNAWAEASGVKHVKMLPDGNGAFTKAMGLLVDQSSLGFGNRSRRYSMLVENGVIKKMFVEADKGGDPYEVSDADTMLNFVDSKAKPPYQVAIFTKDTCPYCTKAKDALKERHINYVEIPLPDSTRGVVVGAMTGRKTVPQVFIDGKHIGGSDDLEKWLAAH